MKQKGYDFPNLEAKGYLEGWIEEDEEAFLEPVESQEGNYLEWTAKNLSEIEYKKKKLDNMNKEKN